MKYCKRCGMLLTDVDDICPSCGSKQSLDVSVSFQPSSKPIPVWPLVLSIIFIVVSLVAAICSLTIILSIIVLPLAIISLIFSVISVVGAGKNEKRCGRNGVLTGAKVIGAISLALSIVSVFMGTFVLCATIFGSNMRNYQTSRTIPSYSYSIPTTQSTQNSTESKEAEIKPLSLAASKIKTIKYNMAVTENGRLLYWNSQCSMYSTKISSDAIPYGIGILGRIDEKYLYISELTLNGTSVLTETTTFKPDGDILYISPYYILYINDNGYNVVSYEKGSGSVLFDLPVKFVEYGTDKKELKQLSYDGVYREYDNGYAGAYSNSLYNPVDSGKIYYRLAFVDDNGDVYYGALQNGSHSEGRLVKQDGYVEMYVSSEIQDRLKPSDNYIKYTEGSSVDYINKNLEGHTREGDTTHLYCSNIKDDLKINLPDGYTIEDIVGISVSTKTINSLEWNVPEREAFIICMKDGTFYYNANALSVKGVDLEPYAETNKAIKETGIVRVIQMSRTWYAIDRDENLYEVNLIK